MGWNTAAVLIENTTIEDAIAAVPKQWRVTDVRMSGFAAFETELDGDAAVARVGAWTVITDPYLHVVASDIETVRRLSESRRALAVVVNYVSTTYGFWWCVDGIVLRSVVYQEGELAEEEGERLPEEEGLPEPWDEDYAFELMERLTGVSQGNLLEHDDYRQVRKRPTGLGRLFRS